MIELVEEREVDGSVQKLLNGMLVKAYRLEEKEDKHHAQNPQ